MKKDKFIQLFSNLFNKNNTLQENETANPSPQEVISDYLQEKQSKGEKLNAKDYFAKDVLENNAQDIFADTLKTMLGANDIRSGFTCNDWNDSIKYASVSAVVYDYAEDGISIILGVSGNADERDTVDVLIGQSQDADITIELDAYPDAVEDASSIYSNATDKVIDFLLSKEII